MEEIWKNSAIITKRNVDDNQNPVSIQLTELKQIIDVHSCVVLNQLPDEFHGIDIEGFTEVYDIEKVSSKKFKVDYTNGVIYFHPNNIGKVIEINYYGIGYTVLSASRIYTKYDKFGNVLETLEELIDKVKLQLQAVESMGGAVEVINRVENANATGTVLHENLSNDIEIGTPLNESLEENIVEGNVLNNNLESNNAIAETKNSTLRQTTIDATNMDATLKQTTTTANATNTELIQTRANAKADIDKINSTGNKVLVIGSSQFVNGQYTYQHNMNSEDLHVTFFDSTTKEPLMPDYKIIDGNNILIRNSVEHPNVKVVLSSSFYQGNSLIGTNAEEFVGDNIGTGGVYTRLKDNVGYKYPITKSDAVYMPDGTTKLTKKISDVDLQMLNNSNKINNINESYYYPVSTLKAIDGSDGINIVGFKYNDLIALYDGLMNAYPSYITKVSLGKDSSNTYDIYKYDFVVNYPNDWIVVDSNIHGHSQDGDPKDISVCLYYFMKDMCENWKNSVYLSELKWNCNFSVIPCANPWGYNNDSRLNYNGVDCNRNFGWNWTSGENRGANAFSEKETQYIRNNLIEIQSRCRLSQSKVLAYLPLHDYGNRTGSPMFPYNVSKSSPITNVFVNVCEYLSNKYGYTKENGVVETPSSASADNYAERILGIPSGTMEFVINRTDGNMRKSLAVTQLTEYIGNLIYKSFTTRCNKLKMSLLKPNADITIPYAQTDVIKDLQGLYGENPFEFESSTGKLKMNSSAEYVKIRLHFELYTTATTEETFGFGVQILRNETTSYDGYTYYDDVIKIGGSDNRLKYKTICFETPTLHVSEDKYFTFTIRKTTTTNPVVIRNISWIMVEEVPRYK